MPQTRGPRRAMPGIPALRARVVRPAPDQIASSKRPRRGEDSLLVSHLRPNVSRLGPFAIPLSRESLGPPRRDERPSCNPVLTLRPSHSCSSS